MDLSSQQQPLTRCRSLIETNIYQAVNDAYLKTFKKPREEIIGHSVAELLGTELFEKQ